MIKKAVINKYVIIILLVTMYIQNILNYPAAAHLKNQSFRYFIPYAPIIRIIFLYSKLLFIFKTVPATFFDSFLFGRKKVSLQKTLAIAAATRCR